MATLMLLQGGEAIPYELDQDTVVLGRHPDCTIQLNSDMVSRKHAQVLRLPDGYYVEDLGSGNGTFVNGKKIEARTQLKPDDRIKLGPVLLRFHAGLPSRKGAQGGSGDAPRSTQQFRIDMTSPENDSSTITDSVANEGGFGGLGVQPEAKLRAVIDIARGLAGTVDLHALLPRILDTLFSVFPQADRGVILLKDAATGEMVPAAQKHRREDEDDTVKLSRTIVNKVLAEKSGIISADATSDARFQSAASISSLTIRSMMCVPLLGLDGEPMGVINVDTQNPISRFSKDDLELLLAVAGQAALSYESTRLLTSHMEKLRHDSEMKIAYNVQHALLPSSMPEAAGYEFFASYDAAQAVGGDYYDAFQLPDNKICLAFGDVAGKGVPAAIVMSRLSSVVQSTLSHVDEVGEAVTAINNHMCANAVEGRFVTFVLVIIDLVGHEMRLIIAGHMSPLIRKKDGTLEDFDEDSVGLPLGVLEDYPYDVLSRSIGPGETIVIYTDGVSEAMNPAGDLYGEDRVREFIRQSTDNAADLGKSLLADVRKHAAGRAQNDDITIMTFGRTA